jgi:hypothetical protein
MVLGEEDYVVRVNKGCVGQHIRPSRLDFIDDRLRDGTLKHSLGKCQGAQNVDRILRNDKDRAAYTAFSPSKLGRTLNPDIPLPTLVVLFRFTS